MGNVRNSLIDADSAHGKVLVWLWDALVKGIVTLGHPDSNPKPPYIPLIDRLEIKDVITNMCKSKQQKHHSCIVPSDHRAIAEIRGICSLCYHHHPPSILSRYSYTTIDDAPTSVEIQVIFVKISIILHEIT